MHSEEALQKLGKSVPAAETASPKEGESLAHFRNSEEPGFPRSSLH